MVLVEFEVPTEVGAPNLQRRITQRNTFLTLHRTSTTVKSKHVSIFSTTDRDLWKHHTPTDDAAASGGVPTESGLQGEHPRASRGEDATPTTSGEARQRKRRRVDEGAGRPQRQRSLVDRRLVRPHIQHLALAARVAARVATALATSLEVGHRLDTFEPTEHDRVRRVEQCV